MVLKIIVVDESGPETGASIHEKYILVRSENKQKLIEGLHLFMPNAKIIIKTKKEYLKEYSNGK